MKYAQINEENQVTGIMFAAMGESTGSTWEKEKNGLLLVPENVPVELDWRYDPEARKFWSEGEEPVEGESHEAQ